MEALITILDILVWVGFIALGGLLTTSLTFVFSSSKHPKLRKHAKWWSIGLGVLIVLLIVFVGLLSEQITLVGEQVTITDS